MMASTMAADDDDNKVDGDGAMGDEVDDDGDGVMGNEVNDDDNGPMVDNNNCNGAPCTAKTRSRYLERPNI